MAAVAIAEPLTLFGLGPCETASGRAPEPSTGARVAVLPGAGGRSDAPDGSAAEPTLAQLVAGSWAALSAHRAVPCPVCGSTMEPVDGAHALPVAGRCRDCGTELS